MKRFHVHVAVEDIAQSVQFYSTIFATAPTVQKRDYAKWMLDDPRVNFAISRRGNSTGIDHLGIEVESEGELAEVYGRLSQAERPVLEEEGATCCYAHSDKQWIADPQGVAWETFLTKGEATVYGRSGAVARLAAANSADASCCAPSEAEFANPAPAAPAKASSCGCGTKTAAE
jgi:catechol-2,3-dioxygenase